MEEIEYTDAGYVTDWDYDGDFKIPVSCCSACMGLVYTSKEDSHTEWHRKLDRRAL